MINFIPQEPMKAEMYTRDFTPNPNRFSFKIGNGKLIFYLDSKRGFILGKDEILSVNVDKNDIKTAFFQFSRLLKALKNGKKER